MHWLFVVILAFVNWPMALALAGIFIFFEDRR